MSTLRIAATALLIGMGAGAWAQEPAPATHKQHTRKQMSPDERAQRMTTRMTQELQLDQTQQARVLEINQRFVREMGMVREQQSDDKRQRAKAVAAQHELALQGVLTPAQFERFKQLKAERVEKQKAMKQRKARPAAPGPDPQR